jgi:hypothetical protein
MKKLFFLLLTVIVTSVGFAQTASVAGNAETMKESVKSGTFQFTMPESVTAAEIERTKKFYVDYFTVEYNAQSRLLKVKMVNNDAESRRVVTRLLVSNGISEINFDGKSYRITEFYDAYMR